MFWLMEVGTRHGASAHSHRHPQKLFSRPVKTIFATRRNSFYGCWEQLRSTPVMQRNGVKASFHRMWHPMV